MGLRYKIEFETLNGRACEISLDERGYTGVVQELVAGGTPLLIDRERVDLYLPMRPSGATLSVYGSDYLQNLYTSDPQGVKVTVRLDGGIHWLGYLSPDTFSQDFSRPEFIYDMEAVSALSSLKHIEFDVESGFVSFIDIIKAAKEHAGYDKLYLTNSVRVTTGSFYDLEIAAGNFWDELDKPMTYYEVLEEIAKYAGCTFVPWKEDLYLLDYKAIRMGFKHYELYDGDAKVMITRLDSNDVTDYRGTGVTMSRIAGKNKATVSCSLYEVKDILPPFNDEGSERSMMTPHQEFEETVKVGKDKQTWKGIVRYYRQPRFTFWHHPLTGEPVPSDSMPPMGMRGSGFVRTTEFEADKPPVRLNMVDEVQVRLYETGKNNQFLQAAKVLTIESGKQMMIHKDIWFCLNYEFKLTTAVWTKQDVGWEASKDFVTNMPVTLRLGNYYYNGSGWSTQETMFYVPVSYKKKEKIDGVYKSVDNTNTYDKGLGDMTGFVLKAPNFAVTGDVELTLYSPHSTDLGAMIPGIGPMPGLQYMYIKNISFAYGTPDEAAIYNDYMDKDDKADVIYENIIGDYIEEAEDIDLKICTNVDGRLALSSVIQNGEFVKTIVTDAYGTDIAENILIKRVVGLFAQPRVVLDPILANDALPWTVYTEPHLNKKFVVAGGEEDVKMESAKYNLIEV